MHTCRAHQLNILLVRSTFPSHHSNEWRVNHKHDKGDQLLSPLCQAANCREHLWNSLWPVEDVQVCLCCLLSKGRGMNEGSQLHLADKMTEEEVQSTCHI